MPRLTTHDYLANRLILMIGWWDREGGAFVELPPPQQRDLHDYYAPSEALTDKEVLALRKAIAKAFPSLPQKAGRAYAALVAARDGTANRILDDYRARPATRITTGRRKGNRVRVKALAHPKRDHLRIAKLLIHLSQNDPDGRLLKQAHKLSRRKG